MLKEFEMTDLGELHHFLGIKERNLHVSSKLCKRNIDELIKFKMENANPVLTPCITGLKLSKDGEGKLIHSTMFLSLIGNMMYLKAARPDIMYAVSLLEPLGSC